MARRIAIVNSKGGTGKTTTAFTLTLDAAAPTSVTRAT